MKGIIILILMITGLNIQGQDCLDIAGRWINENQSILQIDSVDTTGQIHGLYASSAGVDGRIFPLQGWVNANAEHPDDINVSFSVRWGPYGSITSWTGYCIQSAARPEIKTIWNLIRPGKEFDWERIITNASTFVPEN